jgi:5'-3' exonuclease
MRLLIDMSSLLWQSLLASKDNEFGVEVEHEGRTVHVNGWQHGYECAINHLLSVMEELDVVPVDCIFVCEGKMAKSRRKAIYNQYKEGRDSRPSLAYEQFAICRDKLCETFLNIGSQVVTQDGVEADDVLAFLARRLKGEMVILTTDGDMATLINENVSLWRGGMLTKANPYGKFSTRYVPVYKALCGDGNEYKGAAGFGPKAFEALLAWAGEPGLAALEGMIKRRTLAELIDDVKEFKPAQKILDSAEHVYQSYECALLHDEWVDTKLQPLKIQIGQIKPKEEIKDSRLFKWSEEQQSKNADQSDWLDLIHPKILKNKNHAVFDCEIIGSKNPVFLVCFEVIETGEKGSFWDHVPGDMDKLYSALKRDDITWVSFNGNHFDAPLISAAICGRGAATLKEITNAILIEGGKAWEMPSRFDYDPVEFDHIDIIEVCPGVRTSLKTFAGRMGYKTMVDLPFHHDEDLSPADMDVLERYCQNDIGVTKTLFNLLRSEIELRKEMSVEHGIDLRSKSDAQVAEAVLKKAADITKRVSDQPAHVSYKAPSFIETRSEVINDLVDRIARTQFTINKGNGQVESPQWLSEQVEIGYGTYQCGVGGLHSTHDKRLYAEASEDVLISDFDVASYYPNIMLNAGFVPKLSGGAGERFISAYREIYEKRIEAKHSGNMKVSNALKISLNGTFGKLGSPYSPFYSPDTMLGVTLTGQLHLLCLIYDLVGNPTIKVLSANTDGVTVQYPSKYRARVLGVFSDNAERTGFEYEETPYKKIAMKDVNNYIAITTSGKVKRKGLYAEAGLMKNPTMQVCSNMAADYLKSGIHPAENISNYTDIRDFVAIRAVKGGGVKFDSFVEVDDWVEVEPGQWKRQAWFDAGIQKAAVKRKSPPKPVSVGVGGIKFGRIARWYMSTESNSPINYVGSGNKVPKTDGAKLCMTLPDELPSDIDKQWYVNETLSMLDDMGVVVCNAK